MCYCLNVIVGSCVAQIALYSSAVGHTNDFVLVEDQWPQQFAVHLVVVLPLLEGLEDYSDAFEKDCLNVDAY